MSEFGRLGVDINSDVGEGFGPWSVGDDMALLEIVSSANVACGFHAGDPGTMIRTCRQAVQCGVSVGAHVGYRDLVGFGRRYLDMSYDELVPDLLFQLGALDGIARSVGTKVSYIKPHGALYHALDQSPTQAAALIEAVGIYDESLPVLGLSGAGWLSKARQAGLSTISEVFADRAYAKDGSLVSRDLPDAVLQDPDEIALRCIEMVRHSRTMSVSGDTVALEVDSICVHGDTPAAVQIAASVAKALRDVGVVVRSFRK